MSTNNNGSVLTMDKIRRAQAEVQGFHSLLKKDQPWRNWDGQVLENTNMTVSETVVRTWSERLFSWPWRPFKRTRQLSRPDPDFYLMEIPPLGFGDCEWRSNRSTLVAHPVTAARLRDSLGRDE